MNKFEKPGTYVDDQDKAWEMAKAENPYRNLAINMKKDGMPESAKDYEEQANEAGERKLEEYKQASEQVEKEIKEIIDLIMHYHDDSPNLERNHQYQFSIKDKLKETKLKLKDVLEIDFKFRAYDNHEYFKTNIEGVLYEPLYESFKIFNKDSLDWQKITRSIEYTERELKEKEQQKEQKLKELKASKEYKKALKRDKKNKKEEGVEESETAKLIQKIEQEFKEKK